MWDSSFILKRLHCMVHASSLSSVHWTDFYAQAWHPDGFICREMKADGADRFER